jgi:hypothetical protein
MRSECHFELQRIPFRDDRCRTGRDAECRIGRSDAADGQLHIPGIPDPHAVRFLRVDPHAVEIEMRETRNEERFHGQRFQQHGIRCTGVMVVMEDDRIR